MAKSQLHKAAPRLMRITTVPLSLHVLLRGQLVFMKDNGLNTLAVSAPGREVAAIQATGIPHESVLLTRSVTPFKDLVGLIQLIRLIRKFKPDIVHTHTPKAGLIGMLAAWICRVPVRMHTVAGMPLMEARGVTRILLLCSEHLTYFCAQKVYPNSVHLQQYMDKLFSLHRTKFKVLGQGSSNGINTAYFKRSDALDASVALFKERYMITPDDLVFCFIGRIVVSKGVWELVQAFEQVSGKIANAKLILVGEHAAERERLSESQLAQIEANKNIIITGFVDDVRIPLSAADIFVFPSYREGFPNVVLQAACMEVPSIVTDINGSNEIIQDKESGLYVQVRDIVGLRDAMLKLAGDKDLRRQMGERARSHVVHNWDQQNVWETLLSEYRNALRNV